MDCRKLRGGVFWGEQKILRELGSFLAPKFSPIPKTSTKRVLAEILEYLKPFFKIKVRKFVKNI